MKHKPIIFTTFIIILLSAFVYADMTQSSSGGSYSLEDNYNVGIHIEKGWNLVVLSPILGVSQYDETADNYIASDSEIKIDNIKAVYSYSNSQNKYFQVYPNAQEFLDYVNSLSNEDKKSLMFGSVWLYSDKAGYLSYTKNDLPSYDQVDMKSGWNFLTIVPDFKGKTFNEVMGNCNIEKICVFQRQNWDCAQGTSIGSEIIEDYDGNIGTGLVLKVSSDCSLGSSADVPSVPTLPTGSTDSVSQTIGSYILEDDSSGHTDCDIYEEGMTDVEGRPLGVSGQVCSNTRILRYFESSTSKVVFVHLIKITEGEEIYKQIIDRVNPTQVSGTNIYRLENPELHWATSSSEYDIIVTQQGEKDVGNDGTINYYYPYFANVDNPVVQHYLDKYPDEAW